MPTMQSKYTLNFEEKTITASSWICSNFLSPFLFYCDTNASFSSVLLMLDYVGVSERESTNVYYTRKNYLWTHRLLQYRNFQVVHVVIVVVHVCTMKCHSGAETYAANLSLCVSLWRLGTIKNSEPFYFAFNDKQYWVTVQWW